MGDVTITEYGRNKNVSTHVGDNTGEGPVTGNNQSGPESNGERPNSPNTQVPATDKTGMSARKIAANQNNAAQSTGPKSLEGKKRASLNALKHGILSKDTVVSAGEGAEDAAEFENLLLQLREKYHPRDIQDELDVQELANGYWRKRRAIRAEVGAIRLSLDTIRAHRRTGREAELDVPKMFLDLEENRRKVISVPEGVDYLLNFANEIQSTLASKGQIATIHPGIEVLQHFGIRLVGMTKAEASERIASFKSELAARRSELARADSLHLEAEIAAGALPTSDVATKIVRYTVAIDRRIEQIRNRLEKRSAGGDFGKQRSRKVEG